MLTSVSDNARISVARTKPGISKQLSFLESNALSIRSREIREADISQLTSLMAKGFEPRPSYFWPRVFERLNKRLVPVGLPKFGYLLESAGSIIGVLLTIYVERRVEDHNFIQCNVSGWYVDPKFRVYASIFAKQAIQDERVTYINVSPASQTWPILRIQGFTQYSQGAFAATPLLQRHAGVRSAVGTVRSCLPIDHADARLLLDHESFGCLSLWCETPDGLYPFVFRPRLAKGMLPYVQLVYCKSTDNFVRFAHPLGRFLARRGWGIVLIDSNGPIPGLKGKYIAGKNPRFFKGPYRPYLGDLSYTEIAMFGV